MRDDDEMDRLIQNLTAAAALAQSLRLRSVSRLVSMALIDLGRDIAADEIKVEQVSNIA